MQRKLRKSFALTSTPGSPMQRSRKRSSLMKSFSVSHSGDELSSPSPPRSPNNRSIRRKSSAFASRNSFAKSRSGSAFFGGAELSYFTESFRDPTDYSTRDDTSESGLWPSTLSRKNVKKYMKKFDIFSLSYQYAKDRVKDVKKAILRSRPIIQLRLQYNLWKHWLTEEKRKDGSVANGIASLGGSYANWRVDLTLASKTNLLHRMQNHVLTELRFSKRYFISEHELIITALDYTMDSAGMMTICMPYSYDRMYWFQIILLELLTYVLVGAFLKQYSKWSDRNLAIFGVSVFFGWITYLVNPYTEELDRWLDFAGRFMIGLIAIGLVINGQIAPDNLERTTIYAPWKNWAEMGRILSRGHLPAYLAIDLIMVLYLYLYVGYVLSILGFFGVVDRFVTSAIFRAHDTVLDFLVYLMEKRTFGLENTMSGLAMIQQWDDVIKSQRRYALLTWPDVRPPSLVSFEAKALLIKWAALFNLTLENLRSSLGLTILHTAMFSAQGEAARWMIHHCPDLLLTTDSQNDSPITIALKECAYYLYLYGEQKDGALEDGTSYDDDNYQQYYPEVDMLRQEIDEDGEFLPDYCQTIHLTSQDILLLQHEGHYEEPTPPDINALTIAIAEEKKLLQRKEKKMTDIPIINPASRQMQKILHEKEVTRKKERAKNKRSNDEKRSLAVKRFPEDERRENYESGQMNAWQIVSLVVPDENVYSDSYLMRYYQNHSDYHYDNFEHPVTRSLKAQVAEGEGDKENGDKVDENPADVEKALAVPDETFDHLNPHVDMDLQYVIPSKKKVHSVPYHLHVPWDHPRMKSLTDWDSKPRRRKLKPSASGNDLSDSAATAAMVVGSGRSSSGNHSMDSMKLNPSQLLALWSLKDRISLEINAKWNICKFAEILLSSEMKTVEDRIEWSVSDFKALTKMASVTQGKIAQNLAMVCHLNQPEGFVRISDWSVSMVKDVFFEKPEAEMNMVVKTVLTMMDKTEEMVAGVGTLLKQTAKSLRRRRSKGNRSSMRRRSQRLSDRGRSRRSRGGGDDDDDDDDEIELHAASEGGVEGMLSDRVIHFLAEAFVTSRTELVLDDCELSNNGRRAWRAICRALRREFCSFILPSPFTPPKPIILTVLKLPRNELDCGDCVYLCDIFTHQSSLLVVDLSFNQIGARGMMRMAKALRLHSNILTFNVQGNHIGPAAGRDLGLLLKATKTLKVLNLGQNHLGEIHRFPTLLSRDSIPSAARDLCLGLKYNTSLEILDLSYNHLGPSLADILPLALNRHPRLHTLDISGNDLGPDKGTLLLFGLAGLPRGAEYAKERDQFIAFVMRSQISQVQEQQQSALRAELLESREAQAFLQLSEEIERDMDFAQYANLEILGQYAAEPIDNEAAIFGEDLPEEKVEAVGGVDMGKKHRASISRGLKTASSLDQASSVSIQGASTRLNEQDTGGSLSREKSIEASLSLTFAATMKKINKPAMSLTSLSLADNQLGPFAGHAVAAVLSSLKGLVHLNIAGNSLGPIGGERIADQLELLHRIVPREFLKRVLHDIEESKYKGRNAKKRKKIFTNLVHLQMTRNNLGPKVLASLMVTLSSPHCGIVHLDVSDNPVGCTIQEIAGNATVAALDIRQGLMTNKSLTSLFLNRSQLAPTELVTIFGGLASHPFLHQLCLEDVVMDEPAALQLGNVLQHVDSLTHLDISNCRLGPNGGLLLAKKLKTMLHRMQVLRISGNTIGPIAAMVLSEGFQINNPVLKVFHCAGNDCLEEGGIALAKALTGNLSVTDLDLSGNSFTLNNAPYLADALRGLFKNGIKVRDSALRRFVLNDNPLIGRKGARQIVRSLANGKMEYVELRNIGAGPGTGELLSQCLRDPAVAWVYLDISENALTRVGLNQIFWAIRQNKRLRVLHANENQAGTLFCASEDSLLGHGISVPKALVTNAVLRELDLSYNSITSAAGLNIIDAMLENFTIKKLSLRGNLLDDLIATRLSALLDGNEVLEELDLGRNRMSFTCLFEISTTLAYNRRLRVLLLDNNRFGGAGAGTLDGFTRAIMMNYSLEVLNLDGNKLGPEWGMRLAETLARNNTLIQVSLRNNHFDPRAGRSLLNAYKSCPYLLELALTADEVGAILWEEFRVIFMEKRATVDPKTLRQETVITPGQLKLLQSYK
eukprot:scaffold14726_cov186-Ochromonas_danica.AAC.2